MIVPGASIIVIGLAGAYLSLTTCSRLVMLRNWGIYCTEHHTQRRAEDGFILCMSAVCVMIAFLFDSCGQTPILRGSLTYRLFSLRPDQNSTIDHEMLS